MYILLGIVFIGIGLLMLISPETIFKITESWKNFYENEPTKLYCVSIRVGGCAFVVVGILCIIILR